MRGEERRQRGMLMIMEPGDRVPREHPLRRVKELADAALAQLSPLFDEMYSAIGRPSIPPERLLKASLLMALYTVRSERLFCEQLDYNLLFRWFLDMDVAEPSFDHSSFSRNRARLLEHDVAREHPWETACKGPVSSGRIGWEMMDGDAIGFEDFRKCLRDLEIVNICTLAYRPTLHWLKKALRGVKSRRPV